jgi:hypothetical protein
MVNKQGSSNHPILLIPELTKGIYEYGLLYVLHVSRYHRKDNSLACIGARKRQSQKLTVHQTDMSHSLSDGYLVKSQSHLY